MEVVGRRAFMVGVVGLISVGFGGRVCYESAMTRRKVPNGNPSIAFYANLQDSKAVDLAFGDSVFVGVQRGDILIRTVFREAMLLDNFQGKALAGDSLHAAIWLGNDTVLDIGYPGSDPAKKNTEKKAEDFLSGSKGLVIRRFEEWGPVYSNMERIINDLNGSDSDGIEMLLEADGKKFEKPGTLSMGRRVIRYIFSPLEDESIGDLRASVPSADNLEQIGGFKLESLTREEYYKNRRELEYLLAPAKSRPGIRKRPRKKSLVF